MIDLTKRIYNKLTSVYWKIGIIPEINLYSIKKINWIDINGYNEGWFADPFILDEDDKIITILAEEFNYKSKKGRIVKLTIQRLDYLLINVLPILEKDTHLSFPYIYSEGSEIYLFPENSLSGELNIYKYNKASDKAVFVKTIIKQPLNDVSIIKIEDIYYLFGTITPNQNGSIISVFRSDKITGEYFLFQNIDIYDNSARGAGDFFIFNNNIIRPAQDTDTLYGKGLVFQKITFNDNTFQVKEFNRVYPKGKIIGMHTFNKGKNIAIIDGKEYIYPFWGKCLNLFRYKFTSVPLKLGRY